MLFLRRLAIDLLRSSNFFFVCVIRIKHLSNEREKKQKEKDGCHLKSNWITGVG